MLAITKLGAAATFGAIGYKAWTTKGLQESRDKWLASVGKDAGPINPKILQSSDPNKKTCVVIGAGVAGVCSAFEMASQGYSVVILDKEKDISAECSRAPAGGMQKMNPGVSPGMWIDALKSVMPSFSDDHSYEAFRFFRMDWWKACSDPHFIRWFSMFTYSSFFEPPADQKYAQKHMLDFTVWSVDYFIDFLENSRGGSLKKGSGLVHTGALKLLYGQEALEEAQVKGKWSSLDAEPTSIIDRSTLFSLEPWLTNLRDQKKQLSGAVFQTEASSGDCEAVTLKIADLCKKEYNVKFEGHVYVTGFDTNKGGSVVAIHTNRGHIEVNDDTPIIVAAGSWTPNIMRKLSVFVPLYPLKGYNLLMDVPEETTMNGRNNADQLPKRIVADDYMYTTRLNNTVRIASIGEFAGWSTYPDAAVERDLRCQCKLFMPHLATEVDKGQVICGLRPFVSDGLLLIGKAPGVKNVYMNAGPGFNGWKCALGSARVLTAVITQDDSLLPEKNDKSGSSNGGWFDAEVFSPEKRCAVSPVFCAIAEFLESV